MSELKRNISIRLTVISRRMRSDFDRHVQGVNITRSQWAMIMVVSAQPGATQRSIAEILEMSEASAGRLVDRLCEDGFLERRQMDGDRRARAVYLTDASQPLLEKLGEVAQASERQLFQGFSEAELKDLMNYLNRIYANVSVS